MPCRGPTIGNQFGEYEKNVSLSLIAAKYIQPTRPDLQEHARRSAWEEFANAMKTPDRFIDRDLTL